MAGLTSSLIRNYNSGSGAVSPAAGEKPKDDRSLGGKIADTGVKFAKDLGSVAYNQLELANAFAALGGNAFLGGLPEIGMHQLGLATGTSETMDAPWDYYKKKVGPVGEVGAVVAGSLSPSSVPAKVFGKAMGLMRSGRGPIGFLQRGLQGGAVGGGMAGAQAALLGGDEENYLPDPMSVAGATLMGTAGGAGGQMIGDAVAPMIKGLSGAGSKSRVVSDLVDSGRPDGPYSPDELVAASRSLKPGQTLMDLEPAGDGTPLLGRYERALQQADLPNFSPDIPQSPHITDAPTVARATQLAEQKFYEANATLHSNVKAIVGNPATTSENFIKTQSNLTVPRQFYQSLGSTEPGKLGATPFAITPEITAIRNDVATALRRTPETLRGPAAGILDKVEETLRGVTKPRQKPNNQANVAHLLDARKMVTQYLKPGVIYDGSTTTKETANAAKKVLEALDKRLDDFTSGHYGTNKGEFSSYMKLRDSFDFGQDAFSRRVFDDENIGQTAREFYRGLDAANKKAFQEGFRRSLADAMEAKGVQPALQTLLGDLRAFTSGNMAKARGTPVDMIEEFLGPQTLKDIHRVANEDLPRIYTAQNLMNMFRARQEIPESALNPARLGDEAVVAGTMRPGALNLASSGYFIQPLARLMGAKGPRYATDLMKLMTSPTPTETLMDYTRAYKQRISPPIGPPLGMALGNVGTSE